MKKRDYLFILLFIVFTMVLSCVKESNFEVPQVEMDPPILNGSQIELDALYHLWLQEYYGNEMNELTTLTIEDDWYVSGYVISNDEHGNFFEELIIQDKPSNPNIGIRILIDDNPLFTKFYFGRKVYIQLRGLSVGLDHGIFSIGIINGNRIDKINETQVDLFLKRDLEITEISPLEMNILDFSNEKTNLFIQLSNVQFNRNDVLGDHPKTFAGEPEDEYSGERIIERCNEDFKTILSTSTFSDFKANRLPVGVVILNGILTKDFSGKQFNIVLNNITDLKLDDEERCDPSEVDCGIGEIIGSNEIFSDDFETQNEGHPISGNGWTNYIDFGTQNWEAYTDDGSNSSLGISARIGSYNSQDEKSVTWLITPKINFDDQDGETLRFKTSNSFSDGSLLEILYSNNWNGEVKNIVTATWDVLSAASVVNDNDPFGDWISSGVINLNCLSGPGYIAFKYIGSGKEYFDGTYELDEIVINSGQ